ncbi:unnamed protein product [Urochloa humidicola]
MSSVFGGGWSSALAQGRGAILQALGSLSPSLASSSSSQGEQGGVRSGATPPPQRRGLTEDRTSPAAAEPSDGRGPSNAAPGGRRLMSAEMAVAILADCFGH